MIGTASPSVTDPYAVLELHPRAPHDLVEKAYWKLTDRIRTELTLGGNSIAPRLRALNEAYALLVDPVRRSDYDEGRGLDALRQRALFRARGRRLLGILPRRRALRSQASYYEVLYVNNEASQDIIALAYEFRRSQLRRPTRDGLIESELVEEAHATLIDSQRRAQYEAKSVARRPAAPPAAQPETLGPGTVPPQFVKPTSTGSSVATTTDLQESSASAPTPEDNGAPARSSSNTAWRIARLLTRTAAKAARSYVAQRRVRSDQQRAVVVAKTARLRELGLARAAEPEHDRPTKQAPAAVRALAALQFLEGPQLGLYVPLEAGSVILGASDEADVVLKNPGGMIGAGHVRVWHRDGEYILHQLDSFSTTFINGERLDLRLVILEPADEIRIGPHVIAFERMGTPAETPVAAETST